MDFLLGSEIPQKTAETRREADLKKLASVSPGTAASVQQKIDAAAAAKQAADELVSERIAIVGALCGEIDRLGQLQAQVVMVSGLAMPADYEKTAARNALEAFISFRASNTVENRSRLMAVLDDLAVRRAVGPAIQPMLKELALDASNLVREIKDEAKQANVDLPSLIESMVAEPERFPTFAQHRGNVERALL